MWRLWKTVALVDQFVPDQWKFQKIVSGERTQGRTACSRRRGSGRDWSEREASGFLHGGLEGKIKRRKVE